MIKNSSFRYDPLYRVLDETDEVLFIEGKLPTYFDRLRGIYNLGVMPLILNQAKYSKYEHAFGTVHQVINLLEVAEKQDEEMKNHRLSLIFAALFLHLGHLPFTYSTERALLLACNMINKQGGNKAQNYVSNKVQKVLNHLQDRSELDTSTVLHELLTLRDWKQLYKYFSAAFLVSRHKTISERFRNFQEKELAETVSNLVEKTADGYKYLDLADKTDVVQRDALHFGAVRLDISPKHLYNQLSGYKFNPKREEKWGNTGIYEVELIEASLNYLNKRFYTVPDVIWFAALYEKIVAYLINHKEFDLDWLAQYDDDQFKRLITENVGEKGKKKRRLPKTWISRAHDLFANKTQFEEVFTIERMAFPRDNDAIALESKLVGVRKSGSSLLSYPFDRGILMVAEDLQPSKPSGDRIFSLKLFQDLSKRELFQLLRVVRNLTPFALTKQVTKIREGLAREISWSEEIRFSNNKTRKIFLRALELIDKESDTGKQDFTDAFFRAVSGTPSFKRGRDAETLKLIEAMASDPKELPNALYRIRKSIVVSYLLHAPVEQLQYESISKLLGRVREKLIEMLDTESEDAGFVFETLCMIDLLRSKKGLFQFFLYGTIVRDTEQKKDENEFDIIEFRLKDQTQAECRIYACSISSDYSSNNTLQIDKIARRIHDVFKDAIVRTFFLIPADRKTHDWRPKEEEAGTTFNV